MGGDGEDGGGGLHHPVVHRQLSGTFSRCQNQPQCVQTIGKAETDGWQQFGTP